MSHRNLRAEASSQGTLFMFSDDGRPLFLTCHASHTLFATMASSTTNNTSKKRRSGNGFQSLGLSDAVYQGVVRMGFKVQLLFS